MQVTRSNQQATSQIQPTRDFYITTCSLEEEQALRQPAAHKLKTLSCTCSQPNRTDCTGRVGRKSQFAQFFFLISTYLPPSTQPVFLSKTSKLELWSSQLLHLCGSSLAGTLSGNTSTTAFPKMELANKNIFLCNCYFMRVSNQKLT